MGKKKKSKKEKTPQKSNQKKKKWSPAPAMILFVAGTIIGVVAAAVFMIAGFVLAALGAFFISVAVFIRKRSDEPHEQVVILLLAIPAGFLLYYGLQYIGVF